MKRTNERSIVNPPLREAARSGRMDGARRPDLGVSYLVMLSLSLLAMAVGCSDDSGNAPSSETKPSASSAAAGSTTSGSPTNSGGVDANSSKTSGTRDSGGSSDDTRSAAELASAGRAVYMANCIACHNMDATKDGALGPAVAGSSYELLEARIVHGNYPEGYTPKRDSRVMVALPHLEPKLKELEAYLGSL